MVTLTYTQTADQLCPSSSTPAFNLSSQEVDEAVSAIVSELIIDERSTSRSKARYTSAPDHRVSSRTMGGLAMGFIFIVMLLILAMDAPTMFIALKEKVNNIT